MYLLHETTCTIFTLLILTIFKLSEGYKNKWNMCESGSLQFIITPFSGMNYVASLYLDLTKESDYYTDDLKPQNFDNQFLRKCTCKIYTSHYLPFNIELDFVSENYTINYKCHHTCHDEMDILSNRNGVKHKVLTFSNWPPSFSKLHDNIFMQRTLEQTITYIRYIYSVPNVNTLQIDITVSAKEAPILNCKKEAKSIDRSSMDKSAVNNVTFTAKNEETKKDNIPRILGAVGILVVMLIIIILVTYIVINKVKKRRNLHQRTQNNIYNPQPSNQQSSVTDERYVALEEMREIDRKAKKGPTVPFINNDGIVYFDNNDTTHQNDSVSPTTLPPEELPSSEYTYLHVEDLDVAATSVPNDKTDYYNVPIDSNADNSSSATDDITNKSQDPNQSNESYYQIWGNEKS